MKSGVNKNECHSVLMKMKNGCTVKMNFQKCDNPNIENIVTENLLYSYERRMRERVSSSINSLTMCNEDDII